MSLALLLLLIAALTPWGCKLPASPAGKRDYRQDMRDFVQSISAYARQRDDNFIIFIQNGHEILTQNGRADGPLIPALVDAIDGVARESLFYGYHGDDLLTPADACENMLSFTNTARRHGLEVLVVDYCATRSLVDDSYARNAAREYLSFAADHRALNQVPAYPPTPYKAHAADVAALGEAQNFLYLINPDRFPDKKTYIQALQSTDYDLLIVDLFYHCEPLSAAEVATLKRKANGGTRLVVAYLSMGEAEDYRYYWEPVWIVEPPAWLAAENPSWPGNYKVRYWDENWQGIIYGNEDSYAQKILRAGFDGVYLDIIDAFDYFEQQAKQP